MCSGTSIIGWTDDIPHHPLLSLDHGPTYVQFIIIMYRPIHGKLLVFTKGFLVLTVDLTMNYFIGRFYFQTYRIVHINQ